MVLSTWSLGLSEDQTEVMMIFLWMVVVGMMAIAIDLQLIPAAIGYLVAFVIAAQWPAIRLYCAAAGNLIFTINAVAIWRPARLASKT
jgi:hypothetical protein